MPWICCAMFESLLPYQPYRKVIITVAEFGCEFKLRCFRNRLKLNAIKVEISLSGFLKRKKGAAKNLKLFFKWPLKRPFESTVNTPIVK